MLGPDEPPRPGSSQRISRWTYLIPCLVATVLCLPCLSLGYFWDDYYFLASRISEHGTAYLLPDRAEAFYRPIPQGLYFMLLRHIDPIDGTVAHSLNLAALLSAVALLVALVSRLAGQRAALISGLVFGCLGCVPGLVAWVSCSQDLVAIVLTLAALLLRHDGRDLPAVACATGALLSKEPAIGAFPALVFWDHLIGRAARRPRFQAGAYTVVAIGWALIHPGLQGLVSRGFHGDASSYLGLTQVGQWIPRTTRSVLTLLNIPPPEFVGSWWMSRLHIALASLIILVVGFLYLERRSTAGTLTEPVSLRRLGLIAAILTLPSLLMPVFLVRHWAPYFVSIPAAGFAIFLGPAIARLPTATVLVVLSAFLLCGAWYRGARSESEAAWTERVFAEAANATTTVRTNFYKVLPTIPPGSQVVASISSTGVQGIYGTLLRGHALRVWYRDPTLNTVTTQTRRHGAAHEFLVRVAAGLDVIAVDFDSGQVRSSGRGRPDLVETELGRPILNYARAVAAEGNTARALRITGALAYSPTSEIYARRMAAMILLAAGRTEEALRLLERTPALPTPVALHFVWTMLKEASYDERLDEAAFQAFGLSGSDPKTIRWIMRSFKKDGAWGQAAWYARRLLQLAPEDRESIELLLDVQQRGIEPNRMPG